MNVTKFADAMDRPTDTGYRLLTRSRLILIPFREYFRSAASLRLSCIAFYTHSTTTVITCGVCSTFPAASVAEAVSFIDTSSSAGIEISQ